MRNLAYLILVILIYSSRLSAQFSPKQNDILNYNQILLEYPFIENASYYLINIAYNREANDSDNFAVNAIATVIDSTPATIIRNLPYNKKYKWKVYAFDKNKNKIYQSPVNYFSLMYCDYCDTTSYKLVQTYNKKEKYQNGLIWCDLLHAAIDRKGNIVWFFPIIDRAFENGKMMRDLHLLNNGNLSFITDSNVYYIDRNLNVLWNAPNNGKYSGEKHENFHHSFIVQSSNEFYAVGNTTKIIKSTNKKDTAKYKLENSFIIKYDSLGKIVWHWNYYDNMFNRKLFFSLDTSGKRRMLHPHLNSVSIDGEEKYIYVGFRDLSRIVKVEKESKKIIKQYGYKFKNEENISVSHLFNNQHDVKVLPNEELLLFNNGLYDKNYASSAMKISLPKIEGDTIIPIWEFKTDFDTLSEKNSPRLGSVSQLKNGNYLVNTGISGRLFEVTANKEVVWDMMIYFRFNNSLKMDILPQYRISFSSSLYPYAFSANLIKKNSLLKISNEGTENDKYLISIFSSTDNKLLSKQQINISTNENKMIPIMFSSDGSKITLKIESSESKICKTLIIN